MTKKTFKNNLDGIFDEMSETSLAQTYSEFQDYLKLHKQQIINKS